MYKLPSKQHYVTVDEIRRQNRSILNKDGFEEQPLVNSKVRVPSTRSDYSKKQSGVDHSQYEDLDVPFVGHMDQEGFGMEEEPSDITEPSMAVSDAQVNTMVNMLKGAAKSGSRTKKSRSMKGSGFTLY